MMNSHMTSEGPIPHPQEILLDPASESKCHQQGALPTVAQECVWYKF